MDFFQEMAKLAYGEVHLCHDAQSGLKAIVAIHSTARGPALGGARYIPYAAEADALIDALRLARGMSYKASLAGLPLGGGKAVLIRPPGIDADTRRAQLRAFGRFVETLNGRYITSEDSGTGPADMEIVHETCRFVCGASGRGGDPSPFTALGVRCGVEAAAKFALGKSGLRGVHVAVQGVGHVGKNLVRELHAQGCRLTISDVEPARAREVADEFGCRVVPAAEIFDVEAEIFSPCALGGALSRDTIPRLRCAAVAGAANNQLATPDAAELLRERNILYAPDYAINAGGLIHVAQEWAPYSQEEVERRCRAIYDTLLAIFTRARMEEKSPAAIADAIAEEGLRSPARQAHA